MGKAIHRLKDIDTDKHMGFCSGCNGVVRLKKKKIGWRCYTSELRWRRKKHEYILHKKDFCEQCLMRPESKCQFDVDHINGNHSDNSISNLMTLCANCHRLKTCKTLHQSNQHHTLR